MRDIAVPDGHKIIITSDLHYGLGKHTARDIERFLKGIKADEGENISLFIVGDLMADKKKAKEEEKAA